MKKAMFFVVLVVLLLGVNGMLFAQHWNGNEDPSDPIYRKANVGIGGVFNPEQLPLVPLHIIKDDEEFIRLQKERERTNILISSFDAAGNNFWNINMLDRNRFFSILFQDRPYFRITTEGNVGIGIDSPQAKLHVDGDVQADRYYVSTWGTYLSEGFDTQGSVAFNNDSGPVCVGINTQPNGQYALDVIGSVSASVNSFVGNDLEVSGDAKFGTEGAGPYDSEVFMYGGGTLDNGLCIRSGGLQVTGGFVGIGTTDPQSELAVNGTITAKEIEVTINGWSDFVFEENYKLQSLTEVEDYINDNGHLPEIPSAEEVKENGLNIGSMQAKLLQKIEELTLYLIDMQKENENLKERISSLETTK